MGLTPYTASSLLAFIACAILSPFVLLKGKKHRQTYLFAALTFLAGIWSLFPFVTGQASNGEEAIRFARIIYIVALFVPPIFLHLTYAILNLPQTNWDRRLLKAFYVVSVLLLPVLPRSSFIADVFRYAPFFGVKPGPFYTVYVSFFGITCAIGFVKLLQGYHKAAGVRRNQLRYIFASWFMAYLAGLFHFMPAYFHFEPFPHDFLVIAFVTISAYAIFRYRLMDINLAVTRTAVFMVVYASVLGLPLLLALSWQQQLERLLGLRWWVWLWITCALLTTAAYYVNLYFQRRAEARLLREQRQYQTTLLQASTGMTQIRNLQHLLRLIVHILTRTVHIQHAGIFLREENGEVRYLIKAVRDHHRFATDLALAASHPLVRWCATHQEPLVAEEFKIHPTESVDPLTSTDVQDLIRWLDELHIAVAVPAFMAKTLLGIVVLGPKRTGAIYTQDDLRVFSTLANQAALAVDNCLFYEKLKETQSQLFQADKMGSIGQLASGIAHEINNPATIISGEAQLWHEEFKRLRQRLSESTYTPPTHAEFNALIARLDEQFASNITEVARIKEIIRRVLRYSKKGTETFGPVDLKVVIDDAVGLVKLQFGRVTTHVDLPPDLPSVHGNITQLQEIFLNLAINACQAMMDEHKPVARQELTIRAAVDGEWVQIDVADTGLGIPANKLSKIWEAFYTTKASGTGLGLFLVYGIIQKHEGTITVQSIEGQGTTFTVRLPIHHATTTPTQQPTATT